MNFINPFILIGLTAASIPLILHLLNLRKLKIIEFSSLRFLKELQKTKIRRLKIKQIILLILRTLIVIFVVLAFARPTIEGTIPGFSSYAKTSTIIILDNSFSMEVSDEAGNRFNQARNSAIEIINKLKEGDEAAIIPMANGGFNHNNFSRNFLHLKEKLSKIKISYKKVNLQNSIRIAAALLEKANNINKEIFIISDAQSNIFRNIKDSLKLFKRSPIVYFIKIGTNSDKGIDNISIDSLNVTTKIFHFDKPVEVQAQIRNSSLKNINNLVLSMYFNDSRVAQRNIDIPANEIKTVNISANPQQSGLVKGKIKIENDALNIDNLRYFAYIIPEKPKVALIGSNNKIKFIEMIFAKDINHKSPAFIEKFQSNLIPSINFADYDLMIFAGGPYLKSDFDKIRQYVSNGGACLIFADDLTEISIFKSGIAELGFGNLTEKKFTKNSPAAFTSVDKIHPLFQGVFKGTTNQRAIVESPKIYQAYINNAGFPIIKITGGNFLSESKLANGKILYCSVTPDLLWSSIAFTGIFPAIINRSIYYLSSKESSAISVTCGDPLMLSIPKRFANENNFQIIDPKNIKKYKQPVILPSGAILSFTNLNSPGVYSIGNKEKIINAISVNLPKDESILSQLNDDDIIKNIKRITDNKSVVNILSNDSNIMTKVNRIRTGTELWQLFALLALLTAIAELLVERNKKDES